MVMQKLYADYFAERINRDIMSVGKKQNNAIFPSLHVREQKANILMINWWLYKKQNMTISYIVLAKSSRDIAMT